MGFKKLVWRKSGFSVGGVAFCSSFYDGVEIVGREVGSLAEPEISCGQVIASFLLMCCSNSNAGYLLMLQGA